MAFGARLSLTDTGDFTSQEASSIRQRKHNLWITFAPPLAALLLFLVALQLPHFSRHIDTTKSVERRNRILS